MTGAENATVFGIVDPLNVNCHHSHTQKALLYAKTHRLSQQPSKLVKAFDLWRCARKKGMVRVGLCVKKGQKCYISRMCREVPRIPFVTKICTWINDTKVITCAKFGDNRFTNFLFTVVQKCPFPIKTVVTITTACTSVQPWWSILSQ